MHPHTGKKYKTLGVRADYDAIMNELNEIRLHRYPYLSFLDFCPQVGITAQRIYLLKKNPNIGPNLLKKLKVLGIDLKKIIII